MEQKRRQKRQRRTDRNVSYVMFGFDKDDNEKVGFFGKDLDIVYDADDAKVFCSKNKSKLVGFTTPEKWLEFINDDKDLNHNFKFHLVPYRPCSH